MTSNNLPRFTAVSSMATKPVLSELSALYRQQNLVDWQVESVGGVEAARRVSAGEPFDLVMLGSDAIDKLIQSGHLMTGSRADWVCSPIGVAVAASARHPDISTEAALKNTVIECKNLSYSTGPSGVYLEKLFSGWGLAELLKSKTVVPPPGTPVASLLARGDVELGFQQMSELLSVGGIEVVGVLPPEIEFITRFSAGIPVGLKDNRQKLLAVKNWLDFLVSSQAESVKRRHGMNWIVN